MSTREIFQRFISAHIKNIAGQIQNGFLHRQVYVETKKKMYYTAKRIKVVESRVVDSKIDKGWLKPDGCIFKCKKNGTYFYSLGHKHYTLPELKYLNFDFDFIDKDRFIYEVNGKYYQADYSNGYVDYVYELTETIDINTADNDPKLIGLLWDSAVTFMAILANVSKKKGTRSALMDMTETMKSILGIPSNPLRFLVSLGHQYFKYILDAFGIVGSNNKKEVPESTGYSDLVEKIKTVYLTNWSDENNLNLGELFSKILYKNKEMRNLEAHLQPDYSSEREPSLTYFIYDSIILIYLIKHVNNKDLKPELNDEELLRNFYIPVNATPGIEIKDEERYGNPACFLLRPDEVYEVKYDSRTYKVWIPDYDHLDYEIQHKDDNDFRIVPVNDFKKIQKSADYFQRMIAMGDEMRSLLEENLSTDDLRQSFIELLQKQFDRQDDRETLRKMTAAINTEKTADFELLVERYKVEVIRKKFKKIRRWILGSAIAVGIIAIVLTVLGFMAFDSDIYAKNGTAYRLAYAIHGNGDMAYARAMYLEDKILEHDSVADQPYFQSVNDSSITYNKYMGMRYETAQRYREAIRDYTLAVEKDSADNPEAAARLARMYLFGKGGTIDPDKALRYAGIAYQRGKYNQGLYIYTYYINNDYSNSIPCMADIAAEQTLKNDPYLPLIQRICEIEEEGREDVPDQRKLQSLIEGLKDSTFNNTDVRHAALLYILDKQTNGMTDKNGNTIYCKDLYKAAETANYLASRMNSLYGELWLGTTMQNLGVATYYDHFVAAAYNGNSSGLFFARQMAENKQQFEDAQPLLAEEFGRNNDLVKVKKLMEYYENGKWEIALTCLNDLKKGFSDKTIGSTLDIPRIETLIRLNIPDSAKNLREGLQTAPLLERNFLTEVSDDTRCRAALAYADALFYANGYGGMEQDEAKADSLFSYAASLGMEDAAYALGQRLINRRERKSAEKLLVPFFDSSDRMRRLASQFYKLGDPARSQSYLKQIKNPRDIYKTVAEMYVYLEGEGRNREEDSLMYNRIMDSWDITDGSAAYLNGSILALLDDLSGNNKKRQEFYRTLWFIHSAASCQLSNDIQFPDSLVETLNNYYFSTGDRATLRAFFALCNSKDKESAFNRASQIIQLKDYLPAALTWLNNSDVNKVTNKELDNINYLLPRTPGFYANANWHELPAPDEAYTDLNSIFQLN